MAKEVTVNQVIQEGRGFMDQLERGMKERDGPCSLTQKLCIVMPNIDVTHMTNIVLICAEILVYIYSFSKAFV